MSDDDPLLPEGSSDAEKAAAGKIMASMLARQFASEACDTSKRLFHASCAGFGLSCSSIYYDKENANNPNRGLVIMIGGILPKEVFNSIIRSTMEILQKAGALDPKDTGGTIIAYDPTKYGGEPNPGPIDLNGAPPAQ